LDSIVNDNSIVEHGPSLSTNEAPLREGPKSTVSKAFDKMSVKLLILFSLVRPSNSTAYQIFVIMKQISGNSQYQRIGLGVGKKWVLTSEKDAIDFHKPFLWISNPLKTMGVSETFLTEDVHLS
jgi:hypothetical protein